MTLRVMISISTSDFNLSQSSGAILLLIVLMVCFILHLYSQYFDISTTLMLFIDHLFLITVSGIVFVYNFKLMYLIF